MPNCTLEKILFNEVKCKKRVNYRAIELYYNLKYFNKQDYIMQIGISVHCVFDSEFSIRPLETANLTIYNKQTGQMLNCAINNNLNLGQDFLYDKKNQLKAEIQWHLNSEYRHGNLINRRLLNKTIKKKFNSINIKKIRALTYKKYGL